MPKLLLQRCRPDSVREFRAAARERADDALALVAGQRRTAAIYLWGYAAEMTLKAAYFDALGFASMQPITLADLRSAAASAPRLGVAWTGSLHDLRAWAELLVATRASTPGLAYRVPGFGSTVVAVARQVGRLWRETLRYHKNIAYDREVRQAGTGARWLLANSRYLLEVVMPRIIDDLERRSGPRLGDLVAELAGELRCNRPYGQPSIREQRFPKTDAVRVTVIWDKWDSLHDEDRLATILDAYEEVEGRDFRDRIALAIGLTVPEAYESGLLPVQVTAALRRDDPVTVDQIREAMLEQGASVLADAQHPELRFATTDEADACVRRLVKHLPSSEQVWVVTREALRIPE